MDLLFQFVIFTLFLQGSHLLTSQGQNGITEVQRTGNTTKSTVSTKVSAAITFQTNSINETISKSKYRSDRPTSVSRSGKITTNGVTYTPAASSTSSIETTTKDVPPTPSCEDFDYNATNTTISLNLTQNLTLSIKGYDFTLRNFELDYLQNFENRSCVKFQDLSPGNEYLLDIAALGIGNTRSDNCSKQVYTRPSAPPCEIVPNEAESTSIGINLSQIHLDGIVGFDVVIMRKDNKSVVYKETNITDVLAENLQPGETFIGKFRAVGVGNMRSGVCTREIFTIPVDPNCTIFDNIPSTHSIKFTNSQEDDNTRYRIQVGVQDDETKANTKVMNSSGVTFGKIEPGKGYTYTIATLGDGNRTSKGNCSSVIYTVPLDPNCTAFEKSTSKNDITFKNVLEDDNRHYIITLKTKGEQNISKLLDSEIVTFDQLDPGNRYTYVIYTLGPGNFTSNGHCSSMIYTKPDDPVNCTNSFFVSEFGATYTNLQLPNSENKNYNYSITVSKNSVVIPRKEEHYNITKLSPDTQYNISLTNVLQADGVNVKSQSGCLLSTWTRPFVNCSKIKWHKISAGRNVSIMNARYKSAVFMWYDGNGNEKNVTKPYEEHLTYNFLLERGKTYTLEMYLIGHGNAYSKDRCHQENVTVPILPPNCSRVINDQNATTITLDLTRLCFKNTGAISYRLEILPPAGIQRDFQNVSFTREIISYDSLQPGTNYTFTFMSLGKGSEVSALQCLVSGYTLPSNPDCSKLKYTAYDNFLTLILSENLSKGAITYEICLKQENKLLYNYTSTSVVNVTDLLIGESYNVVVTAIGIGQMRSKENCHKTVYTRPVGPKCNYTIKVNETAVTVDFHESMPLPKGAKGYILNATFNTSHFSQQRVDPHKVLNISDLTPGYYYRLRWRSYGMDNLTSTKQCHSEFYSRPSRPIKSIISVTKSSITIDWEVNGFASNYTVIPYCICTSNCSVMVINSDDGVVTGNFTEVIGLAPGSHCNISITSHSGDKSSDPLVLENISTNEGVPGRVTNMSVVAESRKLEVRWKVPSEPNGEILHYNISLKEDKSKHEMNKKSVSPQEELKVAYENLTPGSCYTISIAASTAQGYGERSTVNVYTREEVPGPIDSFNTRNSSSKSIEISWSIPKEPNGVVTSYLLNIFHNDSNHCVKSVLLQCSGCFNPCPDAINVRTSNNEKSAVVQRNTCGDLLTSTFSAENTNFNETVEGLKPYSIYRVDVYALTKEGQSNASTMIQRTSEDVPSDIVNITTIPYGGRINVTFSHPVHPNGIIKRYDIECVSNNSIKDCYSQHHSLKKILQPKLKNITSREILDQVQISDIIDNLQPYWKYSIRIRGYTSAGHGNWSLPKFIRTTPSKPDPVKNIKMVDVTNNIVTLSWDPPCFTNGVIKQYHIHTSTNDISSRHTKGNETSIIVDHLLPFRNYSFTIVAETIGGGNNSGEYYGSIQTLCSKPHPPGNLTLVRKTATSILLQWQEPDLRTCLTNYTVTATDTKDTAQSFTCMTEGFQHVNCTITNLDEYWEYKIRMWSITVNGSTETEKKIFIRTGQAAPGKVTNLTVVPEGNVQRKRSMDVTWKPPSLRDRNGVIISYYINYNDENGDIHGIKRVGNDTYYIKLYVDGGRWYNVTVYACTVKNTTLFRAAKLKTYLQNGAPIFDFGAKRNQTNNFVIKQNGQRSPDDDEKQLVIGFPHDKLCDNNNGRIVEGGIIVSDTKSISGIVDHFFGERTLFESRKERIYKTWQEVHSMDNMSPYIATTKLFKLCSKVKRRKRDATGATNTVTSILIGEEKNCKGTMEKYCNGYLQPGKEYKVRIYLCTDNGCTETPYYGPFKTEPNNVPLIAGSVSGVLAGIGAVISIVLVIWWRRRRLKKETEGSSGEDNFAFDGEPMKHLKKTSKTNIHKAAFARHVEEMHADSNLNFAKEYKNIKDNSPSHCTNAAEQQSTRMKNRYTNILAYDHSRVKLLPTEDEEGSDYINANYIPGFNSPREHIATQGPQTCTKDDFWRMIWEQNVSVIVMLTQLVERGRRKCDQYWPDSTREPVFFGDLIVEIESESSMNDYILRVFSMKLGKSVKNVKHFQFLAWPDMGIPQTTECMCSFVRGVRDHMHANRRGPIVVHCSAGVGRTGTFIAVDHLMQHVRTHDHLDIYNLVMTMRNNRTNMVQTEDQYIFIHDCIKDYIEELEREDEDAEDGDVTDEPDYANAPVYANY